MKHLRYRKYLLSKLGNFWEKISHVIIMQWFSAWSAMNHGWILDSSPSLVNQGTHRFNSVEFALYHIVKYVVRRQNSIPIRNICSRVRFTRNLKRWKTIDLGNDGLSTDFFFVDGLYFNQHKQLKASKKMQFFQRECQDDCSETKRIPRKFRLSPPSLWIRICCKTFIFERYFLAIVYYTS